MSPLRSALITLAAQFRYCVSCSVVLCAAGWLLLPRTLAKANLYMFMSSALYVQISGALDFWYTAPAVTTTGEDCVPDGPHFTMTYYLTYSGLVQSVFGMIGLFYHSGDSFIEDESALP